MTDIKDVDYDKLSPNKRDLVAMRGELDAVGTEHPKLVPHMAPLVHAIDTRVRDQHKPVDMRDVCGLNERACVFFTASSDLRNFANDKPAQETVYKRIDNITGCGV